MTKASLNCDAEALIELRKAVVLKHGQLRRYLKMEVGNALSNHAKKLMKELEKSQPKEVT